MLLCLVVLNENERTSKLGAVSSKQCFEVVDRTDEVSNIYMTSRC
ncbi:TPA: hypothetical protein ACJ1NM_002072 [Streptococcus pneumoniae]